jgi:alkylation response protein AidB-like acyl-CoA dehydrogenase
LVAHRDRHGWRLRGVVPWSTGADHSDVVVVGAAVEGSTDAEQLLLALRTNLPGVRVQSSMPLVALRASHTSSIVCDDAFVADADVLRGPVPHVLAGRKRTLPIGQAFLAMGLCGGAINLIHAHGSTRGHTTASSFQQQLDALRQEVLELCRAAATSPPAGGAAAQLRGRCNDLALRITAAAVAIYKGSGLLLDHPAQRLAREALFLLVWSCPEPVVDCTVELLSSAR